MYKFENSLEHATRKYWHLTVSNEQKKKKTGGIVKVKVKDEQHHCFPAQSDNIPCSPANISWMCVVNTVDKITHVVTLLRYMYIVFWRILLLITYQAID